MRFKKVLLVNFYYKESGYGERLSFPPVGLGYISQYLSERNISHEIIDTGAGWDYEHLFEKIKGSMPDLIGFSLNSICFTKSFKIIKKIKERFPLVAIVVGGPHISTQKDVIIKENEFIDFAIVKEGEHPLAQLCEGEKFENIPGLIWHSEDHQIKSNPPVFQPIGDIPYPMYERFNLPEKYSSDTISILTSRGCPFKCTFCQQSSLLGKHWRGRSAEDVINEIEYWYNRGFLNIHILDDNFALNKNRLLEIDRLLMKKNLKNLELSLISGIRIQGLTKEILWALKNIGVQYLSFGIESGSDKVLKFIQKGITEKDADKAIKMAVDMGFLVRLFFIIGFPTETMEDVQKSFSLALRNKIHEVRFFNLVPYEETGIMHWIKQNGATLLYDYDEYMSDFKRFQRIPLFDDPTGMTLKEKERALHMADEIVNQVEKNSLI